MTTESRERSKLFIDKVMINTDKVSQETSTTLQNLIESYTQYAEVIKDLLSVKSKYVSIVEKYLDVTPVASINNFPGLLQTASQFSQTEMQTDSKEMNAMADLVKDLEYQKESLEDQIERIFKKTVGNIHQIESLSLQASNYLDQLIEDVGEVYGSASMNQLIQRNQQ